MSSITIFANESAIVDESESHFDNYPNAIAIIRCDDKYDEKALAVAGEDGLVDFERKAKGFKFFCEVERKAKK